MYTFDRSQLTGKCLGNTSVECVNRVVAGFALVLCVGSAGVGCRNETDALTPCSHERHAEFALPDQLEDIYELVLEHRERPEALQFVVFAPESWALSEDNPELLDLGVAHDIWPIGAWSGVEGDPGGTLRTALLGRAGDPLVALSPLHDAHHIARECALLLWSHGIRFGWEFSNGGLWAYGLASEASDALELSEREPTTPVRRQTVRDGVLRSWAVTPQELEEVMLGIDSSVHSGLDPFQWVEIWCPKDEDIAEEFAKLSEKLIPTSWWAGIQPSQAHVSTFEADSILVLCPDPYRSAPVSEERLQTILVRLVMEIGCFATELGEQGFSIIVPSALGQRLTALLAS